MLLSQIIATMIPTVKCEGNNLPFTIEDNLKGELNWNMYEITPTRNKYMNIVLITF